MSNRFVLVFEPDAYSDEEIVHFLNARSEIANWIQLFPNAYGMESSLSLVGLYRAFKEYSVKNRNVENSRDLPRYLFLNITDATGLMNQGIWNLLNGSIPKPPLPLTSVKDLLRGAISDPQKGT